MKVKGCHPNDFVRHVGGTTKLQAAKKMEKELRLQIERLQEDKNYNDQMYREVCSSRELFLDATVPHAPIHRGRICLRRVDDKYIERIKLFGRMGHCWVSTIGMRLS